jgi:hypothetical protein
LLPCACCNCRHEPWPHLQQQLAQAHAHLPATAVAGHQTVVVLQDRRQQQQQQQQQQQCLDITLWHVEVTIDITASGGGQAVQATCALQVAQTDASNPLDCCAHLLDMLCYVT